VVYKALVISSGMIGPPQQSLYSCYDIVIDIIIAPVIVVVRTQFNKIGYKL
jgi:hypothetical protein